MTPDSEVPWWAVAILEIAPKTDASRVRQLVQRGYSAKIRQSTALTAVWEAVVKEAVTVANRNSMLEWMKRAPELCRFGALESPRAFVQFTNLKDDTLKVPLLKDFHLRAVNWMRGQMECEILLPYSHGKSWLSSMLVPFMDWAEDPEFTEGRVYFNRSFADYYAIKLMNEIESNEQMTWLFPQIRKPVKSDPRRGIKGDPCAKFWSTRKFSIGGKQAVEPSFEPLTVGSATTGRRYWRTGVDDWVNSDNSVSRVIQDKLWSYFHTGPGTMGRVVPGWRSSHGTRAGTLFTVGTLFHRQDINYRLMNEYRRKGKPVMRVDVFANRAKTEVIWPEERPLEWVLDRRSSLGIAAFNMRLRNVVLESDEVSFKAEDVDACLERGRIWQWGEPPPGWPVLIGFDPASGRRGTAQHSYPAAVALAFNRHDPEDDIHIIEWGRWSVPMPKQCDMLAEMARRFDCPVVVEDQSQQIAYKYWMEQQHPDVRVITFTTQKKKRDWQQGVESWVPLFENRKVVFHTSGAPVHAVEAIRAEFTDYPQGVHTDLLMASWIAKYQWALSAAREGAKYRLPSHPLVDRRGLTTVIDLQQLRERSYKRVV